MPLGVASIFSFDGNRTRKEQHLCCGRKQSGGLFSLTWQRA